MNALLAAACLFACVSAAPGGFYALKETEVRPIANFAVGQLGYEYSLVRIMQKHAQVVQGLLYKLELLVKKTTGGSDSFEVCHVRVHFVPWLDEKKLTGHVCRPSDDHPGNSRGKPASSAMTFYRPRMRSKLRKFYRPRFYRPRDV